MQSRSLAAAAFSSRSLAAAAFSLISRNFYEPLLAKIREPFPHDFFFRQFERKSVNKLFYAPFTLPVSVLSRRRSARARTGCSLSCKR